MKFSKKTQVQRIRTKDFVKNKEDLARRSMALSRRVEEDYNSQVLKKTRVPNGRKEEEEDVEEEEDDEEEGEEEEASEEEVDEVSNDEETEDDLA